MIVAAADVRRLANAASGVAALTPALNSSTAATLQLSPYIETDPLNA